MEINTVQFRANCFKIIDQIQISKDEVIITKRGKPVAKMVPILPDDKDPMLGALIGYGHTVDDLTEPVVADEEWEDGL